MRIYAPSIIHFSREQVFGTYRDHILDLVQYLPNVDHIDVVKRDEPEEGVVTFENHWYAKTSIPRVAQAFIKPENLKWRDYARWNENNWTCDWKVETFFMSDAVICSGTNTFEELDNGHCSLTIEGDLTFNTKAVPGVPKLLAGTIKPQLEKFVVALITPNFETINRGITQYLEAQA